MAFHLYYNRVLQEAWLESGELRAWLSQESSWLDGLQRRLRRSPNAPADVEEIEDDLCVSGKLTQTQILHLRTQAQTFTSLIH